MGLNLSECIDRLPLLEIQRLQKQLKTILKHPEKDRLKATIHDAYSRLGNPLAVIHKLNCKDLFFRLLDAFGILSADQMSPEEINKIKQIPYAVWPDDRHCFLSDEAAELLSQDASVRNENFLFVALTNMSAREKKALAQWIGLEESCGSEKQKARQIYLRISHLRLGDEERRDCVDFLSQHPGMASGKTELYLDEIFADDPAVCSVAWFYRNILPLYQTLAEMEKRGSSLTADQALYIQLFKSGRVIAVAEPALFGQQNRHRIVATREQIPPRRAVAVEEIAADVKENLLF